MHRQKNRKVFLRIENLRKTFGNFAALESVSLEVFEGEFVCFLGPSGCGKTTFLRAIAGLDLQTSGTVEQAGRDISKLPPSARDFGIVFQSYALFPNLTAAKNIAFGLGNKNHNDKTGGKKFNKKEIAKRVDELLDLVGLQNQRDNYPAQLSGGEQQRVALTRALATSPGLLLLDEPLSALDAKVRAHLRREMKSLQRRLGVTTIMVTHDQEEALSMADRIVVMNRGAIEQVGTPAEIYRSPATLFVADFIGAMNKVLAKSGGKSFVTAGKKLQLQTCAHECARGAEVVAAIRPEDVVVRTGNNAGENPKENMLECTVADMEFLGSFWRVTFSSDLLDATLCADLSGETAAGISAGAKVSVELPAHRILVFARS